jgi:formylglycine-generating enzyme required for sulfatase activity
MYPQGATQQGVMDMTGNVWEWYVNELKNPERPEAMQINNKAGRRVLRGGSWDDIPVFLRASLRDGGSAVNRDSDLGFRLVQDLNS